MVCAVKPTRFDDTKESVVVFSSNSSSQVVVKAPKSAQVRVWSTTGLLLGEYSIDKGENIFNLDKQVGVYFLEFIFVDGTRVVERIVF